MTFTPEDYAVYGAFVESLIDAAIDAAKRRGEDVGDPAVIECYVSFDSGLLDEMIAVRIIDMTTPGFRERTVRYGKHGWAR